MLKTSCEICDGEPLLKRKMFATLSEIGINPSDFIVSNHQERFDLLTNGFRLEDGASLNSPAIPHEAPNLGMVIIKPEMMRARRQVSLYLEENLGLDIVRSQRFVYTPEEYWRIQGRALRERAEVIPHGVLVFLLAICEPSEAIFFRHLPADKYKELFLKMNQGGITEPDLELSQDPQRVFTELFVRYEKDTSMRFGVCLNEVARRGFLSMDPNACPGVCWDFSSTFCKRSVDQNIRTFNGLHSPRDTRELTSSLSILSQLY